MRNIQGQGYRLGPGGYRLGPRGTVWAQRVLYRPAGAMRDILAFGLHARCAVNQGGTEFANEYATVEDCGITDGGVVVVMVHTEAPKKEAKQSARVRALCFTPDSKCVRRRRCRRRRRLLLLLLRVLLPRPRPSSPRVCCFFVRLQITQLPNLCVHNYISAQLRSHAVGGWVASDRPRRHLITGTWDSVARVYSIPSAVVTRAFKGHSRGINAVCVTPDGQTLVTASNDNTAKIWDMTTGACTRTLNVGAMVTAVAVAPQVGTCV